MAIKIDDRKIFTCSTTPLPWPKFLVTRMLTRDLFAVANLLVLHLLCVVINTCNLINMIGIRAYRTRAVKIL